MKKWLIALLIVLLVFALCSCEQNTETKDVKADRIQLSDSTHTVTITAKERKDVVDFYAAMYNDSLFTKTEEPQDPASTVTLRLFQQTGDKDKPTEKEIASISMDENGIVCLDNGKKTYTLAFGSLNYETLKEHFTEKQ